MPRARKSSCGGPKASLGTGKCLSASEAIREAHAVGSKDERVNGEEPNLVATR